MPGKATILYVVDDDAAVLRSLERQLNSAGYDAVSFDSPVKFLDAAVHRKDAFCSIYACLA